MISRKKLDQLKEYFASQPVDVVYLFGSQASRKATKLSDVDLAVLFKSGLSESERFNLRLKIIGDVCGILRTDGVDVVDLEKAPLKFKYQAIFPKFLVISKNHARMLEIEKFTTKRYLDFRPHLYFIAQRQLELTAKDGFNL